MRNMFADTIYEAAKADDRICVLVADISPAGSMEKFRADFPDRFINTGVAEQIMIGMAAGMAQRGMKPFCYTIGTFALFRPYEFIRDDLAYQKLPVTVVGIGQGLSYSSLGATHHSVDDVSAALSIPDLHVIAPADPLEVKAATEWCLQDTGRGSHPVYMRLGKAGEPDLTSAPTVAQGWAFHRPRRVFGAGWGDTVIFSYGPVLQTAMEVAMRLEGERDMSVTVINVSTLDPLDTTSIYTYLVNHVSVVVIEEAANGPLGMRVAAVADTLDDEDRCIPVKCFNLGSEFCHTYGTYAELLNIHGLTSDAIYAKLKESI